MRNDGWMDTMTFKASDWHFDNARALFDAARDAARECERCRLQIERMASSEGLKAQRYDAIGHGSGVSDPMRQTDRRIDFENRKREVIENDEALMDYAFCVLYGADRNSGASSLVGEFPADVVWWHWLGDLTWTATANMLDASKSWCMSESARLFREVDRARGGSDGFEPIIGQPFSV